MRQEDEQGAGWGDWMPDETERDAPGEAQDPPRASHRERNGNGATGARRVARDFGTRLEHRLNWTFGAAADRLEETAGQIDRFAARRATGVVDEEAPVRGVSTSLADLLETTADFLRHSDVESLRGDLRRQMRDRPLRTLLLSVTAGWVMGKLLR
jgi:hypothetical protein